MALDRQNRSGEKSQDARSRGLHGDGPERMSTVLRGELREILSACTRALESADSAAAAPKVADLSVTRLKIKQARERIDKLWRLVQ